MTARTRVLVFMTLAIAEAVSWAGLLTGMYFKYLTDAGELGVEIFGPIHGVIFIGYVAMTFVLARTLRWTRGTTLLGLACSIPPFATVLFEVWALRTGRLMVPAAAEPREPVGV